jgi:2-dehydro-3-deoxyphosphogluconate aldolase/(4S)-4-hydroxy-2-oxoglutarate aldolase
MEQNQEQVKAHLRAYRVIAILRGQYSPESVRRIAECLIAGGVRLVEVTLNSANALDLIQVLATEYAGRVQVGAGTVLDPDAARAAVSAGAGYLIAPDTHPAVIRTALDLGALPIPGAFTPTEVMTAYRAGATFVKLFPASAGGPDYLRAICAPLDMVEFVATGGIDAGNASAYLKAGAVAVALGSWLVPSTFDGKAASSERLVERARQVVAACQQP